MTVTTRKVKSEKRKASDLPDITQPRVWEALESTLRPFIARRVASEPDVDDVMQEIFIRMQRGLPSLRSDERFTSWVYQIARNTVADHVRAAKRRPAPSDVLPEMLPDAETTADDLHDDEVERRLGACAAQFIATLPSPYREALTLTELEGLTQQEAADMLGVSLSGMKSRVQRGREKLRAVVEQCCAVALDARRRVVAYEPRTGHCADPCGCD